MWRAATGETAGMTVVMVHDVGLPLHARLVSNQFSKYIYVY
jgi:hypothetical protein